MNFAKLKSRSKEDNREEDPDSFPAAGRRLLGLTMRNIPLW